jgi:hypothetical protein
METGMRQELTAVWQQGAVHNTKFAKFRKGLWPHGSRTGLFLAGPAGFAEKYLKPKGHSKAISPHRPAIVDSGLSSKALAQNLSPAVKASFQFGSRVLSEIAGEE